MIKNLKSFIQFSYSVSLFNFCFNISRSLRYLWVPFHYLFSSIVPFNVSVVCSINLFLIKQSVLLIFALYTCQLSFYQRNFYSFLCQKFFRVVSTISVIKLCLQPLLNMWYFLDNHFRKNLVWVDNPFSVKNMLLHLSERTVLTLFKRVLVCHTYLNLLDIILLLVLIMLIETQLFFYKFFFRSVFAIENAIKIFIN